jgi:P-type E1-E2 ATPase
VSEPKGLTIPIPNAGELNLRHLVLDVNGTIAADGWLLVGVADAIEELKPFLEVTLLTSDTFGTAASLGEHLGVKVHALPNDRPGGPAKADLVRMLGAEGVVAMGNGANDVEMLGAAALGIAVLGLEGASPQALAAARVVAASGSDALALLLNPRRLAATLRP